MAIELPASGGSLSYGGLLRAASAWATRYDDVDRVLLLHIDKTAMYYELLAASFMFGRTFCPIDILNPIDRVDAIARQFDRPLVVTDQADRVEPLRALGYEVDLISDDGVARAAGTAHDQPGPVRGSDPRYYMSTSGSTGIPKLVEVCHGATKKFVDWSIPFYDVGPGDRWAQFSSIGFDLNFVDFLTAIGAGATLVALTTLGETTKLNRFVDEQRITHWHSVPSVVGYLLRGNRSLEHLRMLSFCGEPLLRAQCLELRAVLPHARLINTYGPTEGPLFCTAHEITAANLADEQLTTMPIGQPIPGWEIELADDDQGSRIVLRSDQLAEGYFGIDDDAFGWVTVDGIRQRTFNTGDYVRRYGDALCFSHRRDGVVKINGIRLDLGDVTDACIRAGFAEPIVLVHDGRLALFYEGHGGERREMGDAEMIGAAQELRSLVPQYAVPSRFDFLESLPRTASGKVDRAALARLLRQSD